MRDMADVPETAKAVGGRLRRALFVVGIGGLVFVTILAAAIFLVCTAFYPRIRPSLTVREIVKYLIPRTFDDFLEQYRNGPRVMGYADRHSVQPGGRFHVMLSTNGPEISVRGSLEVYRIGAYGDSDRRLFFRSPQLEVAYSESLGPVSATGCDWPPFATIAVEPSWPSGYYQIDFVETDGHPIKEVAYIVVLNTRKDGDIVVLLSTNTYQAYNHWGGFSLYAGILSSEDKATMVSFDRPSLSQFGTWEYYYVLWLEQQGYKADYITNFDLNRDPAWAEKYALFIVLGHNEYWSKEEFDHVERRIFEFGKNTLFLGANLAYWQVRFIDINQAPGGEFLGRQIVCHKHRRDPIVDRLIPESARYWITELFRAGHRRPESMLMGVMYELDFRPDLPWLNDWAKQRIPIPDRPFGSQPNSYFRESYKPYYPEYYVEDNNLPFFAGTGLGKGESVGGLIGYEWDNRKPMSTIVETPILNGKRRKIELAEGWEAGVSVNREIPAESIRVVFRGNAVDAYGRTGLAEAVYFEAQSGAKVFSAGTIRWPWALSKPGFVNRKFQHLNRNLLEYMLRNRSRP